MWQAAVIPNAVPTYTEALGIGKKLMNVRTPHPNDFQNYGAILYRAGQYQKRDRVPEPINRRR